MKSPTIFADGGGHNFLNFFYLAFVDSATKLEKILQKTAKGCVIFNSFLLPLRKS